jgi:hypothetical protein
MNKFKKILKWTLITSIVLFALSWVGILTLTGNRLWLEITATLNDFAIIVFLITLTLYILISDLAPGSELIRLRIIFYGTITSAFIMMFLVRYFNWLNGYLYFVPLIVGIVSLLLLTAIGLMRLQQKRILVKAWVFFSVFCITTLILIKFAFN